MENFATNLDLFMALKQSENFRKPENLYIAVIQSIPKEISTEDNAILKEFLGSFARNTYQRWSKANRSQAFFFQKYADWLEAEINWPQFKTLDLKTIFERRGELLAKESDDKENYPVFFSDAGTSTTTQQRKCFEDLSHKQKKRRSLTLLEYTPEELIFALVAKLKETNQEDFADIIEHLHKTPTKLAETKKKLFKNEKMMLSSEKVLALYVSLDLSRWQYITLRSTLIQEQLNIFPSYQKLLAEKKNCYPPQDGIIVKELGVQIKLQFLLDHTVKRIGKIVDSQLKAMSNDLKLISKWGFDGAGSQSIYKQKTIDPDFDDSSVFMTSIVPLKLMNDEEVVWENPNPSSTLYCRPMKFEFKKESRDYVKGESSKFKEEITNLQPSALGQLKVVHELHQTMIDGKIANILSDVSAAANCNICLAKPSNMNNLLEVYKRPPREEIYKYGLSSLHLWIRLLECILHISYRLDFQKWRVLGENKILEKAKKTQTQTVLKEQIGILVDIVKQGYGTTNDGNTARRFFRDYEKSSAITGVDERLIKRFGIILQALSCGKPIEIENFRQFCKETAELFVELYPWYYMPVAVHKLLIHGPDICGNFANIPIGILSEEASEARNKDFRNVREFHTRKTNRLHTNEDIMHNLLVMSDPYISHIRPKYSRKLKFDLFPETYTLIKLEPEDEEID